MKEKRKHKKTTESGFKAYLAALPEAERQRLAAFFQEVEEHILLLPKGDRLRLRGDFEQALLYYARQGLPLSQALERLRPEHLGGFYTRPPVLWYPLDDSAKIYPMAMEHGQMAVFRLSVYFREPVAPELLQMALNFTMKRFPGFATTLKVGFFWHYLDTFKRRYPVEAEEGIPCRPLAVERSGAATFRVVYYGDRMSVEFFHILTDGAGGLVFLKALTAEYLRLLGAVQPREPAAWEIPGESEMANEFRRAEKRDVLSGFVDKPAVQMGGRRARISPCRVLHFRMDAEKLGQVAREKNATVTAYLLSRQLLACKSATDEVRGDISIRVPVNLRKFYPSDTLRNFSLFCSVRFPISAIRDADALIPEIIAQLKQKASRESMEEMIAATAHLTDMIRYIPLLVKAPVAKKIYGFLGDGIFSNTLSNLGVVSLPPEMAEQVRAMDFILGPSAINRASCGLVTFGDTAVLSITKTTADPSFEEALYALLERDGLRPEVEGSVRYAH
ncbi:MAG TPA: hypothetical protein IAC31_07870 [Candidatus Faecousia intestinigallinarum]|nr:hypothetical protein [Candidatus Faecousia intestinigallinarum]